MRKRIFVLGHCGEMARPLRQAATRVGVVPLNLHTATVRIAPPPLPDERARALQ